MVNLIARTHFAPPPGVPSVGPDFLFTAAARPILPAKSKIPKIPAP